MKYSAVIFDMDGTLVDNSDYHRKAWKTFLNSYQLNGIEQLDNLFGQTNSFLLQYFFKRELTKSEIETFAKEKEAIYRDIYGKYVKPVSGLITLLNVLISKNIPMAVATSAPKENVDFILDVTRITDKFSAIVDESMVDRGKPAPDLFLKAAEKLNVRPETCLVFEDSIFGVEAALAAGMDVIALTTTVKAENLAKAKKIILDYTEVTDDDLGY